MVHILSLFDEKALLYFSNEKILFRFVEFPSYVDLFSELITECEQIMLNLEIP